MITYYYLRVNLCRDIYDGATMKIPSGWHDEYFRHDGRLLESVNETEDHIRWRSPPKPFRLPQAAVPSTEQAYNEALQRLRADEKKKQEAEEKLRQQQAEFKLGKLYPDPYIPPQQLPNHEQKTD